MSKIDRRATVRALFARARVGTLAAATSAVLAACGGGGGGDATSPPPPPPPPAGPSLAVTADHDTTVASGATIALHATATSASGTPAWTLSGPGQLDATSGTDVHYVPPDAEAFDDAATVTVTATLGTLTKSITLSLSAAQVPGHHWEVSRASTPYWNEVAYANGRFVAVGEAGGIETSTDGTTWTRVDTTDSTWQCVTWGAEGWVAFGFGGEVGTSPDGVSWSKSARLPVPGYIHVRQAAFGNGVYVAVAAAQSFVSGDGKTWAAGRGARTIAFGNGLFVSIVDNFGLGYSADGTHWTASTSTTGSEPIQHVAFGNGTFIATDGLGDTWLSTDGKSWSPGSAVDSSVTFAGFVRGNFYLSSWDATADMEESSDGVSWAHASLPAQAYIPLSLAANADTFVSVVGGGVIARGADVTHLAPFGDPPATNWSAIDHVGGKFVAITPFLSQIATSTDGIAWSAPADLPSPDGYSTVNLYGLAHAPDGTLVSVGSAFPIGALSLNLVDTYGYSHDGGLHWQYAFFDILNHDTEAKAVVHDGHAFVAIDSLGFVQSSPTGEVWTTIGSLPQTNSMVPNSLAYGNGVYVTVGYDGFAASSADARTWIVAPTLAAKDGVGAAFYGVTFDGKRFVAVGQDGLVATSTDGATWVVAASATSETLRAVKALNGELLAVGEGGVAETSVDGVHWTLRPTSVGVSLWTITTDDAAFVVGGNGGTLLRSTR